MDLIREQGLATGLPETHVHTVTVPGACAGWCDLLDRYGRLDRGAVLGPAVKLAEEGFPVAPLTAAFWEQGAENLRTRSPGGGELLLAGRAPAAGERFANPALGHTLRTIIEGGSEAFYCGPIAQRIVATLQQLGGVKQLDDLAEHHSTWETPISSVYGGIRLYECPPNGQGLTALLALNILREFDLPSLGDPLGPGRLHYLTEALRLAFADTRWYVTDPAFSRVPVEKLLSQPYAASRGALIDPTRAAADCHRGTPPAGSDTIYLSVVDGDGNACSLVNSNYMGFGSGIVPEGTGFSLQNRGHNFSLDPEHPNALAPRKRPYHTIIPAMATRDADGSLYASFGVMGGFMQPQGHVQVLLALAADGLDPQAALDRPRLCLEGGRVDGRIALEAGIPAQSIAALAELGHRVRPVFGLARSMFGRGQVITRDPGTGVLCGGSDPRADGCVLGF